MLVSSKQTMNVEVENLPNCITTLRVEVEPEKVNSAWDKVAREFSQAAKIPGYRPGKAPRQVIEARFRKEIREEVEKTLLSQSCREAINEKKLRVLSLAEIQDVNLARNEPLSFTATLVVSPEFELPDYKAINIEEKSAEVSDAEVDEAIENLRHQRADFTDIEGRGLEMEDYTVIDYKGTIDGEELLEVVPKAGKPLAENTGFWLRMTPEAFLPGFADQLVGAVKGEMRDFEVEVPGDFPVEGLGGQKIRYEVNVQELKQKVLPELNDEFASQIVDGKTLEELRSLARTELESQKRRDADRDRRNQIMDALLSQVECELPEEMVARETRRVLSEIVQENQQMGISDEQLKEAEKDLVAKAGKAARDRLKGTFILLRIAEKEEIRVSREDYERRVLEMAMRFQTPPEKIKKRIRENEAEQRIQEEILTGKVLDFLALDDSVSGNSEPGGQA